MILLPAVFFGFFLGWFRARSAGKPYRFIPLGPGWLFLIGILPQVIAFQLPATRQAISDAWASAALVSSQILLLGFVGYNRKAPGFLLLAAGLVLNLLVIVLNGGWMPIPLEVASKLVLPAHLSSVAAGVRFGAGKDMLMGAAEIRLYELSDRFLSPSRFPYRAAFSLGDMLIAAGAFWFLSTGDNPGWVSTILADFVRFRKVFLFHKGSNDYDEQAITGITH